MNTTFSWKERDALSSRAESHDHLKLTRALTIYRGDTREYIVYMGCVVRHAKLYQGGKTGCLHGFREII